MHVARPRERSPSLVGIRARRAPRPTRVGEARGLVILRRLGCSWIDRSFRYDGSTEAKSALAVAAELGAHPADAVVLTVWMPAAISARPRRLVGNLVRAQRGRDRRTGSNGRSADRGGGRRGGRRRGYDASARIAEATESVAKTIAEVADDIDAESSSAVSAGSGRCAARCWAASRTRFQLAPGGRS